MIRYYFMNNLGLSFDTKNLLLYNYNKNFL